MMIFAIFIFTRILFITCMVFILGYVFGPFTRTLALRRITRVAAFLALFLFLASSVFAGRMTGREYHSHQHHHGWCSGHEHEGPDKEGTHWNDRADQ